MTCAGCGTDSHCEMDVLIGSLQRAQWDFDILDHVQMPNQFLKLSGRIPAWAALCQANDESLGDSMGEFQICGVAFRRIANQAMAVQITVVDKWPVGQWDEVKEYWTSLVNDIHEYNNNG